MKTKCHLWEEIRNHFRTLLFDSMAELLRALVRGIAPQKPVFENSSSSNGAAGKLSRRSSRR